MGNFAEFEASSLEKLLCHVGFPHISLIDLFFISVLFKNLNLRKRLLKNPV